MKKTSLQSFLAVLVALLVIVYGTALQSGYSHNPMDWLRAQVQMPVLWLLDFCALYSIYLILVLLRYRTAARDYARQFEALQKESNKDIAEFNRAMEEMSGTYACLKEENRQLALKLTDLMALADSRQEGFEAEARRLTEQAFRAFQGQLDANARQLEAVNLALQYQRAELKEMRSRMTALEPGCLAALPSFEQAAVAALAGEGGSIQAGSESDPTDSVRNGDLPLTSNL